MVLETDFAITDGKPELITMTLDSGAEFGSYACPSCRTYLFHTHSGYAGIIMPTAGTLDDTSWVVPKAHIYTKSKQSWVQIPEDIPTFTEMYEPENVWPKESLARLAEI